MSKLSKQFHVILIVLLLVFSACSNIPDEPFEPIRPDEWWTIDYPAPIGNQVTHGNPHLPWVRNPLLFEEVHVDHGTTLKVTGLSDAHIEKILNDQILLKAEQLLQFNESNLPPYQGIAKTLEYATLIGRQLRTTVTHNANFIISLFFECEMTFSFQSGFTNQVQIFDGLTLDVTTGKQVSLSDMILNEEDAKKWYHDYLSRTYLKGDALTFNMFDVYLELNQPFRGLRHNQKFFLNESSLQLIYDYTTPEVDIRHYPTLLSIYFNEFSSDFAINKRFLSNATIFKEPINSGYFAYSRYPTQVYWDRVHYRGYNLNTTFINFDSIESIPYPQFQALVNDLIDTLDSFTSAPEDIFLNFNENFVGEYKNIRASYYFEDTDGKVYSQSLSISYDMLGNILAIEDLVPNLEDHMDDMRKFLSDFLRNNFQTQINPEYLQFQIKSLSIGFEGFDMVVKIDEIEEYMFISFPYSLFNLQQLPMFQPILSLISQ